MNSFTKEERLCSKKFIDLLFRNGSSFLFYPYRVSYIYVDQEGKYPVKVLINTSKKRFKRAVDRNLIKRRTREAYRLHKGMDLYPVLPQGDKLLLLSIQYVGKAIYGFDLFEKKMTGVFRKLGAALGEKDSSSNVPDSK